MQLKLSVFSKVRTMFGNLGGPRGGYEGSTKPPIQPGALQRSYTSDRYTSDQKQLVNLSGTSKK